MKNKYFIFLILFALINGCTTKILLVKSNVDKNAYSMFGKIPQRSFYSPTELNTDIRLKWQSDTRGAFANSSVSISDSIVFINDLYGRVYAFNYFNGKKLGEIKNKGAVFTTPVVSGLWVVFVVAMEKEDISKFIMYDFTSGKLFREVEIKGRVQTELLKLTDGFIVATVDGDVIKYDKFGIILWKTSTKSPIRSSPSSDNKKIIFGNDNGEIIALNSKDGKVIYRKKITGQFRSGSTISNNEIFIGNTNGKLYNININSGKIIWKFNTNAKILMTPVFDENNLYIGNLAGAYFAIDKNLGCKIWELKTDGLFNTTPLVTKNVLVAPDFKREILIINKFNGVIKSTLELDGRTKLSPVIYRNTLFVGYDRGKLGAYEISK